MKPGDLLRTVVGKSDGVFNVLSLRQAVKIYDPNQFGLRENSGVKSVQPDVMCIVLNSMLWSSRDGRPIWFAYVIGPMGLGWMRYDDLEYVVQQ